MRHSSASQLGWKIQEYGLVFVAENKIRPVLRAKPKSIWNYALCGRTVHSKEQRVQNYWIKDALDFTTLTAWVTSSGNKQLPTDQRTLGGGVTHLPPQSGTRLHFYKQYPDTATDDNKVVTIFTVFGQGHFVHTSLQWREKSLTCDSPASGCQAIPWLHWRGSPPIRRNLVVTSQMTGL